MTTRCRRVARACAVVSAGFGLLPTGTAAQAVRITAGQILRHQAGDSGAGRRPDPERARFISLYGAAYLGEPGQVEGLAVSSRAHFPTIHLLFSAAALPNPDGPIVALKRNLRRLNAHIRVTPLDSSHREVPGLAALEVLGTFPENYLLAQHTLDTANVEAAAYKAMSRGVVHSMSQGGVLGKRVGPMIARFSGIFRRRGGPTQVPYIADHREFGWVWYESPDHVIEGTHHAGATLEVGPEVRYLLVKIRLIAEWRSQGDWQRDLEVVLDLGAGAAPQ